MISASRFRFFGKNTENGWFFLMNYFSSNYPNFDRNSTGSTKFFPQWCLNFFQKLKSLYLIMKRIGKTPRRNLPKIRNQTWLKLLKFTLALNVKTWVTTMMCTSGQTKLYFLSTFLKCFGQLAWKSINWTF